MISKETENVRVRIAPSPTGPFHIGTARTALFNWLFAKSRGGKFILRIEDTDLERSDPIYEKDIIKGLEWLGLKWDEGPYRQSERLDIYEKYVRKLLEEKTAYYCFCSKEELESDREAMLSQGLAPKYSGKCRNLSEEERKTLAAKKSSVIRFKTPAASVAFNDSVRGHIVFDSSLIGDMVIAKNPRTPLYNFAVVIDDFEMNISHVIRGEDHVANTPKQILLQEALGFSRPHYAHLPLILSKDRSKLSKRYAETSLNDYVNEGYLPEAVVNFLTLLGWHPTEDREIISAEETIKDFSLKRVQKAGAVFNIEKLNWLNAQYAKIVPDERLFELLRPFIQNKEWIGEKEKILKIIVVEKGRMKLLSDFPPLAEMYFRLPDYAPEMLIWQNTSKEISAAALREAVKVLAAFEKERFSAPDLEKFLAPLAEKYGKGGIFWPLRMALSGQKNSAGPLEIMAVLGKDESLRRLDVAAEKLNHS